MCFRNLSVKTAYEIQGRLWTGNDEILAAFGQVQLHDLTTSQQGITVKANLSQLFQVNTLFFFLLASDLCTQVSKSLVVDGTLF